MNDSQYNNNDICVCSIHVKYNGDTISKLYIDFNNLEPDITRIQYGNGIICEHSQTKKQYIITCDHIILKKADYECYAENINDEVIKFSINIYKRIPELDLIIMQITDDLKIPLKITRLDMLTDTKYTTYDQNYILMRCGAFINNTYITNIKKININDEINLIFDKLRSEYIDDIPLYNAPIINIGNKKIQDIIKNNDETQGSTKELFNALKGISGSSLYGDNTFIGLIAIVINDDGNVCIRAIPKFLITTIINSIINNNNLNFNFLGLQMNTLHAQIITEGIYNNYNVLITNKNTPWFYTSNDNKKTYLEDGTIIVKINDLPINEKGLIYYEQIQTYVPLNTYIMLESINNGTATIINITTLKDTIKNVFSKKISLLPRKYNDQYVIKLFEDDSFEKKVIIYNNKDIRINDGLPMIIMELSEEILLFYKKHNITIKSKLFNENNSNYCIDFNKYVILLNYKIKVNLNKKLSLCDYLKFPIKHSKSTHTFYVIKMINNIQIKNINTVSTIINNDKKISSINFY